MSVISGPVRCVNKVLMLEAKNIKLLGGEVDKILITNAYENVLLRQLNQQMNLNPRTEYAGTGLRYAIIIMHNS